MNSPTDAEWLTGEILALTEEKKVFSVSRWAEEKRILPEQVTSQAGPYSFSVTPYLREIADCMSADDPTQIIDFMKGAQVGATVGILENTIGYLIDHVKAVPVMLLTADAELAATRMEAYILPMLENSGLSHLIQSSDDRNPRKTGSTAKRLEWAGPGFMVPFGAQNADKLRSISIRYLLEDECDAFPQRVGKDGDPQKLAEARTKSYDETKKIARISTPLLKGTSRIEKGFKQGDQRRYFVPCKSCGEMQVLRFRGEDKETGLRWGLIWKTDDSGALIEGTTRYVCKFCAYEHHNSDKAWMLPRGEWRATAKAISARRRSYHISGLYSPVGFFAWEGCAQAWLEAWDDATNEVIDEGALQEFYNNVLGESFQKTGSGVSETAVSTHKRPQYAFGQIPNDYAARYAAGPVLFLTCQVDVHKNNLAVAVMGWTVDARCFLIDYWRFESQGEQDTCDQIHSSAWQRLRDLLELKVYDRRYRITLTFVDSNYAPDTVTTFCADYVSGVYPIIGRPRPAKTQAIKEFAPFTARTGQTGYHIIVDHYKDRMASVLRRQWTEAAGAQSPYHFNAPMDATTAQLKELTVETRREKTDEHGNTSYPWHRPGNAANELFDLLGYGYAAVDVLAYTICIEQFELKNVDWAQFWQYASDPANDTIFGRTPRTTSFYKRV